MQAVSVSFTLRERSEVAGAVDEAEDVESVGTDLVHQAVVADEQFAGDLITELRHDTAAAREVSKRFRGRADSVQISP